MIYLDNSATTQPCGAALFMMREMQEHAWHNPSALYAPAIAVEKRIAGARGTLARHLGIAPKELFFTGSGTEADSLAILGVAACLRGARRILLFSAEHPAVLQTREQLEAMGHTVEYIPATGEGLADLDAFEAMLGPDVALVSCMLVGNETGAVQPVEAIGRMLRAASPDALLHVDGVQGFLRVPISLRQAGLDLFTISAHKVHGPKGIGALAVRQGIRLSPRIAGGGQEGGLRSGTENTPGIAGFAAAADWVSEQADRAARLREMKLCLYNILAGRIDGLRVNGPPPQSVQSAPHILNISMPGIGGEVLVHALEAEGVLAGTGAACSSKKQGMSAAFTSMRAPRWAADNALRLSFGLMNTLAEAEQAAHAILRCHARYATAQRRSR